MIAPREPRAEASRVKCLLVDDLEENLVALSALLRRDDVELLTARSGAEALELLLAHDVALALLDVQMPEMDGFELAELMRGSERTRHVPIIFVTAGPRDQHRLFKGYDAGAVDFLYKPIEPQVLRNKAEVFFQLYTPEAAAAARAPGAHRDAAAQRDVRGRAGPRPAYASGRGARVGATAAGGAVRGRGAPRGGAHPGERRPDGPHDRRHAGPGACAARGRFERPSGRGRPGRARAARAAGVAGHRTRARDRGARAGRPPRPLGRRPPGPGGLEPDRQRDRARPAGDRHLAAPRRDAAGRRPHRGRERGRDRARAAAARVRPVPSGAAASPGSPEGLGLGLYIAQQIALAHGGAIAVESAEGRTTFSVTLPREVL